MEEFQGSGSVWLSTGITLGNNLNGVLLLVRAKRPESLQAVLKSPSLDARKNFREFILQKEAIRKEGEILQHLGEFKLEYLDGEISPCRLLDSSNHTASSDYFIVINFIDGTSLSKLSGAVAGDNLDEEAILWVLGGLIGFIRAIHRYGIVWNGLDPDHLLLNMHDRKLTAVNWSKAAISSELLTNSSLCAKDYEGILRLGDFLGESNYPGLLHQLSWPDKSQIEALVEAQNPSALIKLVLELQGRIDAHRNHQPSDVNNSDFDSREAFTHAGEKVSSDEIEEYLMDGIRLFLEGSYPDAIENFEWILAHNQNHHLADEYLKKAKHALKVGSIPNRKLPALARQLRIQGDAHRVMGDFDQARGKFEEARRVAREAGIADWMELEIALNDLETEAVVRNEQEAILKIVNAGRFEEALTALARLSAHFPEYLRKEWLESLQNALESENQLALLENNAILDFNQLVEVVNTIRKNLMKTLIPIETERLQASISQLDRFLESVCETILNSANRLVANTQVSHSLYHQVSSLQIAIAEMEKSVKLRLPSSEMEHTLQKATAQLKNAEIAYENLQNAYHLIHSNVQQEVLEGRLMLISLRDYQEDPLYQRSRDLLLEIMFGWVNDALTSRRYDLANQWLKLIEPFIQPGTAVEAEFLKFTRRAKSEASTAKILRIAGIIVAVLLVLSAIWMMTYFIPSV